MRAFAAELAVWVRDGRFNRLSERSQAQLCGMVMALEWAAGEPLGSGLDPAVDGRTGDPVPGDPIEAVRAALRVAA